MIVDDILGGIPEDLPDIKKMGVTIECFENYNEFTKFEIAQKLKHTPCKLTYSDRQFLYFLLMKVPLGENDNKVGHPTEMERDIKIASEFISWLSTGFEVKVIKDNLKKKINISPKGFDSALRRGLKAYSSDCRQRLEGGIKDDFLNTRETIKKHLELIDKYLSDNKKNTPKKFCGG